MNRYSVMILLALLKGVPSLAQDCEDLYRTPDRYHIVQEDYAPVCGCDGKTYRNSDAAYWWGAINSWTPNTVCDDFDMDLYPNVITNGSSGLGHLRIYMKYSGSATVTIYNAFGRMMFSKLFYAPNPEDFIPSANPYDLYEAQAFPRGIYLVIVSVGNTKKVMKFLRVTE